MKNSLMAMASILLFLLFSSMAAICGDQPVLYIYTWKDYFASEVINEFQKKYDCQVNMTYFVSNEDLHNTLTSSEESDFDIVTPSSYMSSQLWRKGLLAPLRHGELPNLHYLDPAAPRLTDDPGMVYSIPFTRTVCGIGYHRRLVRERDLGGWEVFSNPRYFGRTTMIADMRETIGAALKHLGYSLNTTDDGELARAGLLLSRWKEHLSGMIDDSDRLIVNDSDRLVSHAYNGDIALMIAGNPDIGFHVPEEGSSQVTDDFVLLADSTHKELAHAFINHMFDPEMAEKNMEGVFFYMFIPEALKRLPPELKANPAFIIPDNVLANCETLRDLGPDIEKYRRIWEQVMGR